MQVFNLCSEPASVPSGPLGTAMGWVAVHTESRSLCTEHCTASALGTEKTQEIYKPIKDKEEIFSHPTVFPCQAPEQQ